MGLILRSSSLANPGDSVTVKGSTLDWVEGDGNFVYLLNKINSGGGGSPAGSDTQIQYNNAGAFGASSDFTFDNSNKLFKVKDTTNVYDLISIGSLTTTNEASFGWRGNHDAGSFLMFGDSTPNEFKLYTDGEQRIYTNSKEFTLGLNHTAQSAVIFTGSGLDDLIVGGTFSGTYPTTYTVTITDTNQDFLVVDSTTITGGSFAVSDIVTNGTGGSATILGISNIYASGFGPSTVLIVNISSGSFTNGDTIDNGSGVTGLLSKVDNADLCSVSDGVTTYNNVVTIKSLFDVQNNVILKFSSKTGHTLSESWTWDYTTVNQNVLDFSNTTFGVRSFLSSGEHGISQSAGVVSVGNLSGGNNTKITIDDVAQTINFNGEYSFPFADGTSGQTLVTDGAGTLSWAAAGGGGQIAFTKTKAEIDALIAGGDLVAGALYEITGVHPTLYDDGTTSGTTVYLRAISGSELEVQGMGKFYNPKYNQAVDGFGIWENKMYGTFSSISGTFDYLNKEAVTADNSATGILLADGMIQWVSGDWSTATSITGDVSSATATVAGFVTPTYSIGDKVIWGGYSWTNVNGNIGASVDVLNLDAEWIKNVYDTTNYNIAYDLIEYDYANDMIIRRHEIESNVDIRCSKAQFDLVGFHILIYNPISVQQFGNAFNISIGKGQLNINVNGGYNESVNFCGAYQLNLTFGQGAKQYNLTFGQGQGSFQSNLTFGHNANQSNLTFGQNANQYNLTFGQNASQDYLTFGQYASQDYLTFGQGSYQTNLTFGQNARQYNLTFGQNARQYNLTFGQNAYQRYLTFGQGSSQGNLTFDDNIIQTNIEFDINTQLVYNFQTLSTSIIDARFRFKANGGVVIIPNISSATYIYDDTLLKDIYTRPDGTLKLKFMNDLDVLEVHGIAD